MEGLRHAEGTVAILPARSGNTKYTQSFRVIICNRAGVETAGRWPATQARTLNAYAERWGPVGQGGVACPR